MECGESDRGHRGRVKLQVPSPTCAGSPGGGSGGGGGVVGGR